MALISEQEVQLRISTRTDGKEGVDALSLSVEDLEKDLRAAGEAAKLSAAKQADAATRLTSAKQAHDGIKLSLQSAQNEYKYLADRAKESGAAQSIFAQQALVARQRIAELKTELAVTGGNVRLLGAEHRAVTGDTRRLTAEQLRLKQALREAREEAEKQSLGMGRLKESVLAMGKAYAGVEAGRFFLEANLGLESLERSLAQILGSSDKAAAEIQWLKETTGRLGVETLSSAKAYTSLAAAAKGTSLEGEGTRRIFEAVAGAMSKLGKSSADTEGALQAISQMMGKGVVSMEEMRQQLADRLPGAMQAAADASGLTVAELTAMISTGQVLAEDLLPKLADGLKKMYGTSAKAEGTISAWNRLKNSIAETFQFVGQSGVMTALAVVLEQVSVAVRGLTGAFDLLGRSFGITFGAITELFRDGKPVAAVTGWKTAITEAADEIQASLDKANGKISETTAAQQNMAVETDGSTAAANESLPAWLSVVKAYGNVAVAAKSSVDLAEKNAAARAEEGKTAMALASALGTESEKRDAALTAALGNATALQAVSVARQLEHAAALAQIETLSAVAAAEGEESAAKQKSILEVSAKAAALQAEAEKSTAAAIAARQHAAALQTESEALQDNSTRLEELKAAAEQAAMALEVVRINKEFGAATTEELANAEIAAAQAAALYRDALADQTEAIKRKAVVTQGAISLEQAGIRLAIEQQKTIYEVAKARGQEYAAAQAMIEIRKLEIKLQELNAKAKAAEANAIIASVKARREELIAANALTEAKQAELDAQEASARVKQVEAEIAAETADRMKELAEATEYSGSAAANAARGYDKLRDSLEGVADAAEEARHQQNQSRTISPDAQYVSFNAREEAIRAGATEQNVGEIEKLIAFELERLLAENKQMGRKAYGYGPTQQDYDSIVQRAMQTYQQESSSPASVLDATSTASKKPAYETTTFKIEVNLAGRQSAFNVTSRADADVVTQLFQQLESEAARA